MTIQPWEDGFIFTMKVKIGATDIDDAYDSMNNLVKQLKKRGSIEEGAVIKCDEVLPGGVACP